MASNILKAAAAAALAANGGVVQECPGEGAPWPKYHEPDVCRRRPIYPVDDHGARRVRYEALNESGVGASLVPNTETVTCPMGEVKSLENPTAMKGIDTSWIVENTSKKSVVLAWIVDGIAHSPFHPDMKPMEDSHAILKPGGE